MRWVLQGGCAVLLVLLPLAVACCCAAGKRMACAVGIGAFAAACCLVLPSGVLPVLLWCGAGVAMCLLPWGNAKQRAAVWACLCLGMACGLLLWANIHYYGQVIAGLAEDMVAWVDAREDAPSILLRCYYAGFSRLEETYQPAVSLLGTLAVTPRVRAELLYSLRTTLEGLLPGLVAKGIVLWAMLTAVLVAALPDGIRRRHGQSGELPRFAHWQPEAGLRRGMRLMALGYLAQAMGTSATVVIMGSLCAATFWYGYALLGLAVLEGVGRNHGTPKHIRRLWMALGLLLAPVVLVILGLADGAMDPRKLRRLTDDEGGEQQ